MQINSVTYRNADGTVVTVVLDDGAEFHAPWPIRSWHRAPVEKWLEEPGNAISPYVAPPPPTKRERLQAALGNDVVKALVRREARTRGLSVAQLLTELEADI